MDIKPSINRVTREAIEAALSAYHSEPDPPDGKLSEPMRIFANIVAESKELQETLCRLAGVLSIDGGQPQVDLAEAQWRAQYGEFTAARLLKLAKLCAMFFWVGWHTRESTVHTIVNAN